MEIVSWQSHVRHTSTSQTTPTGPSRARSCRRVTRPHTPTRRATRGSRSPLTSRSNGRRAGLEGQARFVEWKEASRTQLFTLGRAGMPYYYRGKVKVPCEPLPGTIGILAKAENARNKKKGTKKSDIVDILYIHLNQKYSGRKFSRLTVHSSRDRSRFEGKECSNFLFPGHP